MAISFVLIGIRLGACVGLGSRNGWVLPIPPVGPAVAGVECVLAQKIEKSPAESRGTGFSREP